MASPVQLPVEADSFWPCCLVPLIVGGDVFTGAAAAELADEGPTTSAAATPSPRATTVDTANRDMCIVAPIPLRRDPGQVRRA